MTTLKIPSLCLASLIALTGCSSAVKTTEATFDFFEYQGQDARFDRTIDSDKEYLNPNVA